MNSHLKRWLTAIVGVPLVFVVLFYVPENLFSLFMILLILAVAVEYKRLIFGRGFTWEGTALLAAAFLIPAAFAAGDPRYALLVVSLTVISAFLVFLFGVVRRGSASLNLAPVAALMLGIVYIPVMLSYIILLRRGADGALWVAFVLVLAFSGDIAAYYVGTALGRRKLLPLVSPGKTVEGAVGAYAGSIAGALLFRHLFLPALPVIHAVVLGVAGSTLGQLGDLCESVVKRTAGAKDSGSLLPGHGGFMDRLDCLMFTMPFVYYYRCYLI